MSNAKKDQSKTLNESSGGYMSVDRVKAFQQNWEAIRGLTKPFSKPEATTQTQPTKTPQSKPPGK